MNINGTNYPSIGFIRAKPLEAQRWLLSIYPPADTGPLAGTEGASHVEVVVDGASVERIARAAPHLIPDIGFEPRPERFGLHLRGRSKVSGLGDENRPGPSPSMQTVISEQS